MERRLDGAARLDHAMRADGNNSKGDSQDHGTFDREEMTQMFLAVLLNRPQPLFAKWESVGVEVGGKGGCAPLLALIAVPGALLVSSLPV